MVWYGMVWYGMVAVSVRCPASDQGHFSVCTAWCVLRQRHGCVLRQRHGCQVTGIHQDHVPLDFLGAEGSEANEEDCADLAVGGGDGHLEDGGDDDGHGGPKLHAEAAVEVDGRELFADPLNDTVPFIINLLIY